MIQFNGYFDGNVITPDKPLDLQVGQKVRVTIDPAIQPLATQIEWQRLNELREKSATDTHEKPRESDSGV